MVNKNLIEFPTRQLIKVISGGQRGADRGALEAAKTAGITTGGVAPKDWRTCEGADPSLVNFGLTECWASNYDVRTKLNVEASCGTVAIASNFQSPGEVLTKKLCDQLGKPILQIDTEEAIKNPTKIVHFIINNNIRILNVAGNRDYLTAKNPSLHHDVAFAAILQVISILEQLKEN